MYEVDEETEDNLRNIKFGVRHIAVSSLNAAHGKLYQLVLYDVTTLENEDVVICMEISPDVSGYEIIGKQTDDWSVLEAKIGTGTVYEDFHTLMMHSSPLYADAFRDKLQKQLQALADREKDSFSGSDNENDEE